MKTNIISFISLKKAMFYPYVIRITDEIAPDSEIEQKKQHCFIYVLAYQLLLSVGVSAVVADSLQRHATRLL